MAIRRFLRAPRSTQERLVRQMRPSWWRFLPSGKTIGILFAILLAGAVATIAWVAKDIPDPNSLDARQVAESTKMYDRTGTVLLYQIGDVRRTRVSLSNISPAIVQATVALEDQNFYKHHGIDIRGLLRALWTDVRGKPLQGGSSITQQLVKRVLLSPEKTLSRKIREAILAVAIERRYTKDQILEMYLNEITYGSNAYGIEEAARTFFGTSAKDVSLAQAALLASLPNAPTYYSPYGSHVDELIARQHFALDRMTEEGYITKEQAAAAKQVQMTFTKRRDQIIAPHFVFYVREQLEKEYGSDLVEQGGLKVITTLDANMQRAAEDAVTAQASKNLTYNAHNAALVAANPKNGDILSMVGSVDYFDTNNDGNVNVTIRSRSPGSSFKPIVYASLFQKGYTTETVLSDVPTEFSTGTKSYRPNNYDLKTSGPVTIRSALARSLNIPAVEALYIGGLQNVVDLAHRMGISTLNDPNRFGLSLVLGGGEVRLIDMVSAYSVFATEGIYHPHRSILKVEDAKGKVLEDTTKDPISEQRVLEPQITRMVSDILSDNNARAPTFGTNSALQLGARPVAAKTGTAQEYRDGWTIGYTPSLVAGVWVGNNDNSPMTKEPGAYTAAPIWNSFMRTMLANTPIERFTKPDLKPTGKDPLDGKLPARDVRYDKDTNTILPIDCPIPLGQIKHLVEFHSILYYVRKDDPQGSNPDTPETDPMFDRWEAGIAAWRDKWNTDHPDDPTRYVDKLPNTTCDPSQLEGRPTISFTSPVDERIRTSPLRISVDIAADSPITKAEFFANDQKIGEAVSDPWEAFYRFPSTFSGRVILKVLAYTENGKVGAATRTILVNTDDSAPSGSIQTPSDGSIIKFPMQVKVNAEDSSGIALVDVLYRRREDTHATRVGRTSSPSSGSTYIIPWTQSPSAGQYLMWVVVTDKTGNTAQTPAITITVP